MSGEALTVLANCRRLAADWRGAHQAITQAGRLIKEPAGQARLLSIHGSVACDTGNLDLALDLLQRAAALYRAEADPDGTRRTAVKLAGTLLAAGRPREAVELAESLGETGDVRLDVLARGIVIEGLVLLGRAEEALLRYLDGEHLWRRASELRLRVGYLGALLLNGLGSHRDAEKLLRGVGQAYAEAETGSFRRHAVRFSSRSAPPACPTSPPSWNRR
jgi:tetratricopeptide (TPR) repeat protein